MTPWADPPVCPDPLANPLGYKCSTPNPTPLPPRTSTRTRWRVISASPDAPSTGDPNAACRTSSLVPAASASTSAKSKLGHPLCRLCLNPGTGAMRDGCSISSGTEGSKKQTHENRPQHSRSARSREGFAHPKSTAPVTQNQRLALANGRRTCMSTWFCVTSSAAAHDRASCAIRFGPYLGQHDWHPDRA